jgi:hypothetical protein
VETNERESATTAKFNYLRSQSFSVHAQNYSRLDNLGQRVATFEKRIGTSGKTTWRACVRRQNGSFLTKSFAKKSDGET